ncbi:arylacetamide deacetylase [Syngnathus typhle]|uniref:arylacetamide deacetylase n=1 Tax=Syngnathus typhle TaxID=161592 RepID=UPI002A6AD13B|nr:arylacetamide deacetylase [Syngnathus typhle]XP_061136207.1 arylacetamide deacetylase [Syngnathus typhle]XP_061136208.1 arylacetamide deacetylase [Syngnathus typhle]
MRLGSIFLVVALCSFSAYYIYEPIPENIDERWKLMLTDTFFRSLSHLADFSELIGLKDYMGVMYVITLLEKIAPVSDKHLNVTVEAFDGVEVLLYQPKQQSGELELRRALIYLHGGGWCLGSSHMGPYDFLARKVATELDAVILSVEYRLAPPHHFPVPYEDVYRVVKHFLQIDVLAQYSVDPGRIAVSGDSAGGNLAAAVTQQLLKDPTQKVQFKAQALIYPVLQALDLNTPSYQQNQDMPILPRTLMVRFWSEYFTSDRAFFRAMMANAHNNPESSSLLKFVNWSAFLPETYHGKYNYSAPEVAQREAGLSFESLSDPRASPLLVPDAALRGLPKAYIMTCEYDVLRDDGIMYATRLRAADVEVTHEHYDSGFHGAIMFTVWPTDFRIGHRMTDNYIKWLEENL